MTSVDQKLSAVKALFRELPALFHRQGAVVATWRNVDGRLLGPYYSLRYRDAGRQCSLYLGRTVELATKVRAMLVRLQRPRRQALQLHKLRAAVQASLRRQKQIWDRDLRAELGLYLKGFEIRGGRGGRSRQRAESSNQETASGKDSQSQPGSPITQRRSRPPVTNHGRYPPSERFCLALPRRAQQRAI